MAIIQGIPGLEVYIEVSGKRLKEYDVPQGAKDVPLPPETKQSALGLNLGSKHRQINNGYVAKYIEVESGTYPCVQFAKAADLQKAGHHIAYNVKFDDNELELRHQPPGPAYEDWEDSVDSVVVGSSQEQRSQRFRFENLTRIDGKKCIRYARTSNVGTIRVGVYHMNKHRLQIHRDYHYEGVRYEKTMSDVSAKRRKLSHCIGVENGARIENPEVEYKHDFLDKDKKPFAVFDFHYRSQECLNTMGISTEWETKAEAVARRKKDLEAKHQQLESQRQQLELEGQRLQEKCLKNERRLRRVNKKEKNIERKEQERAERRAKVRLEINKAREIIDLT
ncbi:hypothetical protein F4803DRAFT_551644 [Xylaria telfairii]|nr:hypothetical protein F4803DRAFT_551644 [Xylaria telfairii]